MNGKDLEKLAQQNTNWAKTGFSTSNRSASDEVSRPIEKPVSVSLVRSEGSLTKEEIKILRRALYCVNAHIFSSCKCKGCEPAVQENRKLFHDLDKLIKNYEEVK
jgi:hypothetical protein